MLSPGQHLNRLQARRKAWWVVAVLVLTLLAPGVSTALAKARGEYSLWEEICRSPASVQLANDADRPGAGIAKALDQLTHGHCPACHLQAQAFAAPPPMPVAALRVDLDFAAPERFWSAPQTPHAWRAAPARAPPLLG